MVFKKVTSAGLNRISKLLSNKILLAYFYLSEPIHNVQFNVIYPVDTPGELDWDANQKNTALGCFFVGYVMTQLGGRFAELYGGKLIFGVGILITSLFTLLMPLAATTHFYLFVFFRGIVGFGQGVTMPVMHVMLANWAPPSERSQLSTFIYGGTSLGTVVSLLLTGPICKKLGWEAAFYVSGGCGLVWFIFWSIFVYDTPAR